MTVIQYQCDVCNRIIDIQQNKKGFEVISNCIITDGCHGKLSQINIKLDHIRGNFPNKVDNLDDYIQRKILYNHIQSIKVSEWKIIHNLGISPIIQIFIERPKIIDNIELVNLDNNENVFEFVSVEPSYIKIISKNEILVGFDKPEKGKAQLLAKSTNKSPNQQLNSLTSSDTVVYKQLSNSSEVTIGTLNSNSIITLGITFYLPDGILKTMNYTVDDNPSIISPWFNFNKIYKDKTYVVRSFNINDLDVSNIEFGSSFTIDNINNLQVNKNDILFLLSEFPYTTNDKIVDKIVDMYDINSNVLDNTLYNNGEFFINDQKLINIYPPIKIV